MNLEKINNAYAELREAQAVTHAAKLRVEQAIRESIGSEVTEDVTLGFVSASGNSLLFSALVSPAEDDEDKMYVEVDTDFSRIEVDEESVIHVLP